MAARTSLRPAPDGRGWRAARCDQGAGGGLASATALKAQALALLAGDALDHGGLGIDDDEPAGGIDERRLAEAQGEIVRLAEQDDQVGLAQHLGEGAEPGIVDAARALHRHDRHAGGGLELREQRQIAGMAELRAGEDQGRVPLRQAPPGCGIGRRQPSGCCGARSDAAATAGAPARPRPSLQQVERQAQMHRPRPAGHARCARPRRARRPALPPIAPVQDALVTGAAISAWRSSWKAPRPTSLTPACPDSSTSGDSAACAVQRAAAALVKPAPPLTRRCRTGP